MRIKRIDFDDEGNPESALVHATKAEMLLISVVLGKMNSIQQNEVMSGGSESGSEIYDALTGEFFNRYWDGGVQDALREHG